MLLNFYLIHSNLVGVDWANSFLAIYDSHHAIVTHYATITVLVETILAVMTGLSEAHWPIYSLTTGIAVFIFDILIWWLYEINMRVSNSHY